MGDQSRGVGVLTDGLNEDSSLCLFHLWDERAKAGQGGVDEPSYQARADKRARNRTREGDVVKL